MINFSQEVAVLKNFSVSIEEFVKKYLIEVHVFKRHVEDEDAEYVFYVQSNPRGNIHRVFTIPVDFFSDSNYDLTEFERGKYLIESDMIKYLIEKLNLWFYPKENSYDQHHQC